MRGAERRGLLAGARAGARTGTRVAALAALALGCSEPTRCEVGDVVCDGDVILECRDGIGGEGGEYVAVRDCENEELVCQLETIAPRSSIAGCVPPSCVGTCPEPGARACSPDLAEITECVPQPDGCHRRRVVTSCDDVGLVCARSAGDVACAAP